MINKIKRKILVSCDDGTNEDIQMISLLLKYKIPAVFYIAPHYSELSTEDIRKTANNEWCKKNDCNGLFEIGAHTINHPEDLKKLNDKDLVNEITGSKTLLEEITGKTITKFCYPSGRFNERVKEKVKLAGFKEARTVNILNIAFPSDSFEINPSIHIHPNRKEYKDETWVAWANQLFDLVIKDGGRFEIFLHSWEVEKYHQWEFLEDFLSYMDDEMKKINYSRKI